MSAWSVKTRRALSWQYRDARANGLKTTAMHEMSTSPPLAYPFYALLGENAMNAGMLEVSLIRGKNYAVSLLCFAWRKRNERRNVGGFSY